MKKRLCLFAGFDKTGQIQEYVRFYVQSLSEFCDVYYYADCSMAEEELGKLSPYVKQAFALRHAKYDFGSWQALIQHVGWEVIQQYDELILANDSCYGPLYQWEPIFEKMEETPCDFWGMTSSKEINWHLQSYFLVFKQQVFQNTAFQAFWESIQKQPKVSKVITAYELTLAPLLLKEHFKAGAYIAHEQNTTKIKDITNLPFSLIKTFQMPLLKVKTFTESGTHLAEMCDDWEAFLARYTDYPTQLIHQHLQNLNIEYEKIHQEALLSCCKKRLFVQWGWWLLVKITKQEKLLVKVCKVPILSIPLSKRFILKCCALLGITQERLKVA
jgi:lipopolysaccharide biosynthesis protein